MERQAVQSSEIAIVGYDSETSTLEVTFRRGGVYEYASVPAEVHASLMKAPSLGTYFSDHIQARFSYRKVR